MNLLNYRHYIKIVEWLGAVFDGRPEWAKTFDRSQWVLMFWFLFALGVHGQPALWPNSPPLPEPYPGDGVCEVSRGENHANAPSDCGRQPQTHAQVLPAPPFNRRQEPVAS